MSFHDFKVHINTHFTFIDYFHEEQSNQGCPPFVNQQIKGFVCIECVDIILYDKTEQGKVIQDKSKRQ